ncbi:MAG: hypothetical protein ACFB21_11235, partial [Opitutales bacterium]
VLLHVVRKHESPQQLGAGLEQLGPAVRAHFWLGRRAAPRGGGGGFHEMATIHVRSGVLVCH